MARINGKLVISYLFTGQIIIGQDYDDDKIPYISKCYFLQFLSESEELNRKAGIYLIPIMSPISKLPVDIKKQHVIGSVCASAGISDSYEEMISKQNIN